MKKIALLTILILIVCSFAKSQTYVLLDRKWYKSAILTDTVTKDNLSNGWYPVYRNELDSLILLVEKFKNLREDGLTRKFYYSGDFKTEHTSFQIENIKRAYGDGYEINLTSSGPFGNVTLKLSDPRLLLPANQKVIRAFLSYLKRTGKDLNKPLKKKK